jgi:hypothetical protein
MQAITDATRRNAAWWAPLGLGSDGLDGRRGVVVEADDAQRPFGEPEGPEERLALAVGGEVDLDGGAEAGEQFVQDRSAIQRGGAVEGVEDSPGHGRDDPGDYENRQEVDHPDLEEQHQAVHRAEECERAPSAAGVEQQCDDSTVKDRLGQGVGQRGVVAEGEQQRQDDGRADDHEHGGGNADAPEFGESEKGWRLCDLRRQGGQNG